MALNPSIILAGQQPDFLGTIDRANSAAQRSTEMTRQNKLNQLYQTQGAGIMAGDENALNALAQYDPRAALGVQQTYRDNRVQEQEIARRNMQQDRQFDLSQQELGLRIQDYKRKVGDAQAAEEAANVKRAVTVASGAQTPEDWDRIAMQFNEPDLVGQFARKDEILREYMTIAEALEADAGPEPDWQLIDGQYVDMNDPASGARDIPGIKTPEDGPLSPEGRLKADLEAGRITPEQFNAASQKTGVRVTTDGKGGFTYEVGVAVGDDQTDPSNPTSAAAMMNSIEGILNDPALDTATGLLSFMQAVPGTPQRRVGARIRQLDGQAFLQAFEKLKGAGQITEIEGTKATQAIGRLDAAQRTEDYVEALTEVYDVLSVAAKRPVGWAEQQSAAPQDMPKITDETEYDALESGTMFIAPDGTQRRKP